MLQEEIVVGKAYVSEAACIVREVIEEVDNRRVKYIAFELESGRLLPARHRVCSKNEMKRWADREAEPSESDRLHPFQCDGSPDESRPSQRGVLRPDEARSALDGAPGAHTFPRAK